MENEEPVTQQPPADSPEQDTESPAEPDTPDENGEFQPEADPPRYKP